MKDQRMLEILMHLRSWSIKGAGGSKMSPESQLEWLHNELGKGIKEVEASETKKVSR